MNARMELLRFLAPLTRTLGKDESERRSVEVTRLAQRAMEETTLDPLPESVPHQNKIQTRELLELCAILLGTDAMVALPRVRPDEEMDLMARADVLVYGREHARFEGTPFRSNALEVVRVRLGWDEFDALDMVWVCAVLMRANARGIRDAWYTKPLVDVSPRSTCSAFYGRFTKCSRSCRVPFAAMSTDDVMFCLGMSCSAMMEPSKMGRTLRWREHAHFAVRALLVRCGLLCAFEHAEESVSETHLMNTPRMRAERAENVEEEMCREEDVVRELTEARSARERMEESMRAKESRTSARAVDEDEEDVEMNDPASKELIARRRAALRRRDERIRSDATRWLVSDDEDDAEDAVRDAERKLRNLRRTLEAEAVKPRTDCVSMGFARETRLMGSWLMRELLEAEGLEVVWPKLVRADRRALIHVKEMIMMRILESQSTAATDFRKFLAGRRCTAADFAIDETRFATMPAKSAMDVMTRRGFSLGEDDDARQPVVPDADTELMVLVHAHRLDFEDFALNRFVAQSGLGILEVLLDKTSKEPWYTRPKEHGGPIAFFCPAKGGYVLVLEDDWGSALAFPNITRMVVYCRRRDLFPERLSLHDSRGRPLPRTCDLKCLKSCL